MSGTPGDPNDCWRLGDVVFDPLDGTLWREGQRVDLTPKVLAILKVLVEAAPRAVTKEQLLSTVWPETVVAEAALTQRVRELRQLLGDDARTPRYVETLARRGYRLIAPVERVSAAPAAAPEVSATPAPATVVVTPPRSAPGRWWRWWPGVALAAVVALVGLAAWQASRPARVPAAPATPVPPPFAPRRAVAVLEVSDASGRGDTAWVGIAMAEMLTTELGAGGTLRIVRPDDLAQGARELGLSRGVPPGPEDLRRLRALLGLDLLVTGRYRLASGLAQPEVALDLEIREVASGTVLASVHEVGMLARLAELASRAGGRLRQVSGVPTLPPAEATQVRRVHPDDVEASRLYAEGLSRFRAYEFGAAVTDLEEALSLEPESVPVRTALAHALTWTGQWDRARDELGRAFERAEGVPRELQLVVEADYRELTGEWERALEINRSLHVLYPDQVEYGLSLATLLASHGQEEEARRVLAELRRLPEPLGQDPRIDLAEAWMHESDLTAKLAAASRAAERARELGARLLLAAARIQQGRAYRGLGKLDEAQAAFEEAWRLREAAGETSGVGKALRHVAAVERDRGQLEEAAGHLRSAEQIARRLGETWLLAGVHRDMAAVALDRGSIDDAARHLEAARVAAAGQTIPEETALLSLETARLALMVGPPTHAAAAARGAAQVCAAEKLTGAEARARALLVRALLVGGEVEAAAVEAAAAGHLAASTDDRGIRLEVAIVGALVAAASSGCASALPALDQALTGAPGAPIGLRLEARAVVGECARQLGDETQAREVWRQVATEAERLGFRPVGEAARRALVRLEGG